jgi:hypothetical protein
LQDLVRSLDAGAEDVYGGGYTESCTGMCSIPLVLGVYLWHGMMLMDWKSAMVSGWVRFESGDGCYNLAQEAGTTPRYVLHLNPLFSSSRTVVM